jgi:uncharacterized protein
MGKKQITRKNFIIKTLKGIAGVSLIQNKLSGISSYEPVFRGVGHSGIMVSPICIVASATNEISLIKYALEKGLNFIDTARSYGNGNNELLVGRAVNGLRSKVIIQSKIRLEENELPSKGMGMKGGEEIRSVLFSKLEASLKTLNTNYIDILLYHDAINKNLLFHNETLKFFSEMKKSGVIKAHGFSTSNKYMDLLKKNNSEDFYDVIMVPFNPEGAIRNSIDDIAISWDQKKLIPILKEAGSKGIGVIAMYTCMGGGKYSNPSNIQHNCKEAVTWVIKNNFISSASLPITNFEQVDECALWLKEL